MNDKIRHETRLRALLRSNTDGRLTRDDCSTIAAAANEISDLRQALREVLDFAGYIPKATTNPVLAKAAATLDG